MHGTSSRQVSIYRQQSLDAMGYIAKLTQPAWCPLVLHSPLLQAFVSSQIYSCSQCRFTPCLQRHVNACNKHSTGCQRHAVTHCTSTGKTCQTLSNGNLMTHKLNRCLGAQSSTETGRPKRPVGRGMHLHPFLDTHTDRQPPAGSLTQQALWHRNSLARSHTLLLSSRRLKLSLWPGHDPSGRAAPSRTSPRRIGQCTRKCCAAYRRVPNAAPASTSPGGRDRARPRQPAAVTSAARR